MSSRAERRQSTLRAGSPERKRRYCQKFSPGPARLRPCRPWITVAAIRRASKIKRGMDSASVRAVPPARWVASNSCFSARLTAIRLSDAALDLVDDGFRALAVGARREGECHAVFEDRFGHLHHIIDRGREASVDERAGARYQHQRLAGAWARAPGDQLTDIAGLGTRARRAHQVEDRLDHRLADREASHQALR